MSNKYLIIKSLQLFENAKIRVKYFDERPYLLQFPLKILDSPTWRPFLDFQVQKKKRNINAFEWNNILILASVWGGGVLILFKIYVLPCLEISPDITY